MKAQVITQQPLTLDFDAHQFEFLQGGRELNTVWEKLIENTPARAVIRWVDEKLYLFALPSAMVEITRSGLSEIMPLRNPVFQYYPAFRSEPLAVSEEGNIYRSYPGAESHLMWRSNLPANRLSPLGLSPGSILRSPARFWSARCLELTPARWPARSKRTRAPTSSRS